MDKDLEQAKLIANSYDGDNITTEDVVTACMGMARWKDENAALVSEMKNPSGSLEDELAIEAPEGMYKIE